MGFFKTYFEIDIPHGAHWWQKIAEVSRGSVAAEEQEGLGNFLPEIFSSFQPLLGAQVLWLA